MKELLSWLFISLAMLLALGVLLSGAAWIAYPPIVEARHQGLLEGKLRAQVERVTSAAVNRVSSLPEWTTESAIERATLPQTRIIPGIETDRLVPATPTSGISSHEWRYSFGDFSARKYSIHDQINRKTLGQLRPAWVYETPESPRNVQATPIYTGSALVLLDSRGAVVAIDPATGALQWEFHPATARRMSRGLIHVDGDGDRDRDGLGTILFTSDGRLYAIDAQSGQPKPGFGRGGSVVIGYEARVAPIVDGDTVIVASYRPGLHGFDLKSGRHLWSLDFGSGIVFFSRLRRALSFFSPASPGRPWGGMALDPDRHLVFVTTSDPPRVGLGVKRPGNNEPANSVIAVNTRSGRIAWSFQDVAHDLWDLDVSSPPVLGTIDRDGQLVDVVFVVTKTGNLHILDRVNGRPIFDLRQRRAPVSIIPGEMTAPYQHDPVLPEPFGRMAFTLDDITDIGPENAAAVASQLEQASFGFFAPHVPNRATVFFGLHGGATQFGAAFDPIKRRLFVASNHVPASFTLIDRRAEAPTNSFLSTGAAVWQTQCAACHGVAMQGGEAAPALRGQPFSYSPEAFTAMLRGGLRNMPAMPDIADDEISALHSYLETSLAEDTVGDLEDVKITDPIALVRSPYRYILDDEGYPGSRPPWGTLTAYDVDRGRILYQVPLGRYEELMERGLPPTGTPNTGGPIVTAGGLIFVSGTLDRLLRAFDAETGVELWEHNLPFIGSASPMTFVHDEAQYLVLPATGGGVLAQYHPGVETGSSFIAFRLTP